MIARPTLYQLNIYNYGGLPKGVAQKKIKV